MLMDHLEPLRHVYAIAFKTKLCFLTSADARLIPEDGILLDGISSPHVYNRIKNKKELTHLC